ncbi:phage major capsid protein [Sphingomonas canadensis]|uniref:Phage major capsid protein n=1 Tax=Sphingomonas canadensis TaxID=1219257 RepID=A0ABW3HCI5_9SPHN|nr:phage major capsid protein [Sphingomonas canadensis]MCW3837821.1 phage major capsid protein [Sphingomonas canadensis]
MLICKVTSDGGAGLDFVLSDATLDRYGDTVDPKGWDLRWFKKNPIALFGHNASFPIGTWSNVRVEGGKLIGRLNLAARGTSARIDELISLVEQGVLRAVSVGFIPRKSEPMDPEKPYRGTKFLEQELLETSLVSVPANPAALAVAKSLNLSAETIGLAFGEHADPCPATTSQAGGNAPDLHQTHRTKTMNLTLSQRIENAQQDLNIKRDKLAELTAAESLDLDAIEELNTQIDTQERSLAALKASEAKIGAAIVAPGANGAGSQGGQQRTHAQPRRPLGHSEKDGMDLLVRAMVVRGVSHFGEMTLDQALEQRYPGHEAVGIIAKADQTVGTTGTAGWASELVQTAYVGFLNALVGHSIWPELVDRSMPMMFDRFGSITLPRRNAGGAGGGFVGEGSPIRVGRITTAAATLTPKKMGVIVPFTKELAKRSTPAIEGIVRQAILEDTGATLDPLLLDATASSAVRPAGLLYGIGAAATGFAGGDYQAVRQDFKALLAPFFAANGADNIVVLMNSAQGLNLSLMEGPVGDPNWFQRVKERVTIIESTNVTANRLIALRVSDFAGAGGDPEFDVSEQATIHMEDTSPLEIVSGTGPTAADPVRSLWQTASVGVRMLMDVSWTMRRTGMVQWIDGTSW